MSILGQAALTGVAGGISGLISGSAEREAAKEANDKIDDALARVDSQRDKTRKQFSNTAQSFLTNYALVRDPQRSEGIRASYSQERQRQDATENKLDDIGMQLEANRPSAGGSDVGDLFGGLGIGAAQGAASGIGQAIGAGKNPFSFGDKSSLDNAFKPNYLELNKPDYNKPIIFN